MANSGKKKNKIKKTIMIFGISSFVGSNLAQFLKNDYKIIGTYHSTPITIPGVLSVPCNVLSKEEVQILMFAFKPDIAIYCVGLPSVLDCSHREAVANALNTSGLLNVTENCARYKAQICYISSCHVFGGENKKYTETDLPNALTLFGGTQASSEFYMQKNSLNYIVFRTCPLYGRSYNFKTTTWLEKLEYKMTLEKKLGVDNSVYTGFLDVYYLAMTLKLAFEKEFSNRLFQLSSTDIKTHYGFAKKYCEVFNHNADNLQATKWHYPISKLAHTDAIAEELFFDLDTSNIESFFKIKLPTIRESLELTYKRFKGNDKSSSFSSSSDSVKYI